MLTYLIKRLFGSLPTMAMIITIAFFMMRLAPGGPFDAERRLPPEIEANLRRVYHLDEPLLKQFGRYLYGITQGNFGPSFQYKDYTVKELIFKSFPVSLTLGLTAIAIAFVIGSFLGSLAALRQNTPFDYAVMTTSMVGIAVPNFVMAPILTLVLGVYLRWLPVGGWNNGDFSHMFLPVLALALPQIAYIARLTRGSMIEVLRSNYIRTARAKGLKESVIILKHALKPALLPIVTYMGPVTAAIITGSVVIEQIFGIPGLGRYFVQGALNRDYTLVMGIVIFYGFLIIFLNLLVDIIYGVLDPKVRYT